MKAAGSSVQNMTIMHWGRYQYCSYPQQNDAAQSIGLFGFESTLPDLENVGV